MDSVSVLSLQSIASGKDFACGLAQPPLGNWFACDAQPGMLAGLANQRLKLHECSPLVIHGPESSGKSKLARVLADAHRNTSRQPAPNPENALVMTIGEFDKRVRHAAVVGDLEDLLSAWQIPSCWILEDYHRFGGSPFVDQMLVRLLDARNERCRLSIFCGRQSPWSESLFSRRLQSRISAGLVVSLDTPSRAVFRRIVEWTALSLGLDCQPDSLDSLCNSNVGLGPIIEFLRAYAKNPTRNRTIVAESVRAITCIRRNRSAQESRQILASVARHFNFKLPELIGHSRRQALVKARGVAICLLRDLAQLNWTTIAEMTGRQDHSTVIHAYAKTKKSFGSNPLLADAFGQLKQKLSMKFRGG